MATLLIFNLHSLSVYFIILTIFILVLVYLVIEIGGEDTLHGFFFQRKNSESTQEILC